MNPRSLRDSTSEFIAAFNAQNGASGFRLGAGAAGFQCTNGGAAEVRMTNGSATSNHSPAPAYKLDHIRLGGAPPQSATASLFPASASAPPHSSSASVLISGDETSQNADSAATQPECSNTKAIISSLEHSDQQQLDQQPHQQLQQPQHQQTDVFATHFSHSAASSVTSTQVSPTPANSPYRSPNNPSIGESLSSLKSATVCLTIRPLASNSLS